MNRDLWSLYLKYQTEYAYGGGGAGVGPSEAQARIAAAHLARVRTVRDGGPALVIGPGGPDEVVAVESAIGAGTEMHVLTAHDPEADWIRRSLHAVHVVVGDMHNMPYDTGHFAYLFASNVLEHALAPLVALMECRRVLAGGAIATFVIPSFEGPEGGRGPFHLHCLSQPVWTELLRKTGFTVADYRRVVGVEDPAGHYNHFVCATTDPPYPLDRLLGELVTYKATHLPDGATVEAEAPPDVAKAEAPA